MFPSSLSLSLSSTCALTDGQTDACTHITSKNTFHLSTVTQYDANLQNTIFYILQYTLPEKLTGPDATPTESACGPKC